MMHWQTYKYLEPTHQVFPYRPSTQQEDEGLVEQPSICVRKPDLEI